jgi:CRP/FNR family transcriptional regulator, anaerobic regulatory protein
MPNPTPDGYFPPPRQELLSRLQAGDTALGQAMHQPLQRFAKGKSLVKAEENHQTIYRLVSGCAARVRKLEDGRRQIIAIFLPGDLLAVKTMLLYRQPDGIECLSPCNVRSLPYTEGIALVATNADVAFRFMWQLAEDERRLHNQVAMLGRGNAVERISAMLVDINGRLAKLGLADSAPIVMRQQDIADYLGLTMIHVNRTLRSLRQQGAITVQTGRIAITDAQTVGRYAAPMLDTFEREAPEFGGQVDLS